MTKEKTIDASKKPQDQLADELLSDDELDKVAGGAGTVAKDVAIPSEQKNGPGCKNIFFGVINHD